MDSPLYPSEPSFEASDQESSSEEISSDLEEKILSHVYYGNNSATRPSGGDDDDNFITKTNAIKPLSKDKRSDGEDEESRYRQLGNKTDPSTKNGIHDGIPITNSSDESTSDPENDNEPISPQDSNSDGQDIVELSEKSATKPKRHNKNGGSVVVKEKSLLDEDGDGDGDYDYLDEAKFMKKRLLAEDATRMDTSPKTVHMWL
ncbi:hypothetical protein H4219_000299 [Mycoemilia scoparia]|uniref:Uncharacterized protein n=1 Tax=Mycoemilia scoparia TaxID=417184 RepID=A0A9W8DT80_9FUNG|nr:hypothetical protein H4219_000299 [Mycoemilia scoparia]